MKKIVITTLVYFIILNLSAQKVIERHVNLSSEGSVSLNIQIADSITIITWNKKEAYVKASVNVNENKDNDYYKLDFDETGGNLDVKAAFDFPKDKSKDCNCNYKTEINFVIYLPENRNLTVETINGNITISGQTGGVKAKSISGFIDMAVSPQRAAKVELNTITGSMYSDFDFHADGKNMKQVAGASINSNLNGGGDGIIRIETISGDIFFHKS